MTTTTLQPDPQTTVQNSTLAVEIDRCVMCGMCSQYCPTYRLTQDENESPRGRIALINAVNRNQLSINDQLVNHLEHCTYCRACEDYCPSGVRFSLIMDQARAIVASKYPLSRNEQRLQNILASPDQTRRLGRWLERYQRWGLQRFLRRSGLLSLTGFKQEDKLLPEISETAPHPDYSPAITPHQGDVAFFTGCISNVVDRQTLDASRRLLNMLGYGVYTPAGQTCCGALHRHSGQSDKAIELARSNLAIFETLDVEAIVHTSTGCTSFLKEYKQLFSHAHQDNKVETFTHRVTDINQFLSRVDWPKDVKFTPLEKRVAVHEPCSARNVLHEANAAYRLLAKIPGLDPVALPGNEQCCGASGSHLLAPTSFTRQLRQDKVNALSALNRESKNPAYTESSIDTLITTNISCALHLAAGLREAGINVEVLHPVSLLIKQIALEETCTPSLTSAKVVV